MTAALLSIGTELTRGELVDTNAPWLADQLVSLGFDVREKVTVPDEPAAIVDALRRLSSRVKVIVSTGGLGPTSDDMTAAAAAESAGVPLERDMEVHEHIRRLYARRGRELTEPNAKQADFPQGAEILANEVGTAPGFGMSIGEARAFFMPGVPSEMKPMFRSGVYPRLAAHEVRTHQVHVRTFGLPESEVARRVADLECSGITLGYRASFPEVELKVLATGDDAVERAASVGETARERLGQAAYGDVDDSFPAVVGRGLRDRDLTIAVAESCTGGLIGAMLTAVPGSSAYVLLDAVTYANSAKTKMLGVEVDLLRGYGAVSSECAASMAEGARRLAGSDIAVATTGIAGPGGGSDEKPVGTVWFGLASERGTRTFRHVLPGDRDRVRRRAAHIALDLVRREYSGFDLDFHDTLQESRVS